MKLPIETTRGPQMTEPRTGGISPRGVGARHSPQRSRIHWRVSPVAASISNHLVLQLSCQTRGFFSVTEAAFDPPGGARWSKQAPEASEAPRRPADGTIWPPPAGPRVWRSAGGGEDANLHISRGTLMLPSRRIMKLLLPGVPTQMES